MDDNKPANEPTEPGLNKIDLSQLQDFTFGTQWTEVKPVSPGRRDRDDRRDRRDDGGRGEPGQRRDRRGFRKPAGPPSGAGESEGGQRPPRGDRGDRPQGEGYGHRGGPRRGGDRREFRGGGDRREGHPQERAPYISPYFNLTCYPEDAGFAALVKAVRASCRTFQLFEITKAVLEKNDRFVVVIQRKSHGKAEQPKEGAEGAEPAGGKPAPLYMSVPDHLPFETEDAAISHVMSNHLAQFFDTDDVEIDPPKGNFPIINKCGITGELLGPPNYHRYQHILQQHHATRLGRMSFDRFRERIESVRDPEVVTQWMEKMKKATRFTWVFGRKPAAPAPVAEQQPAPAGEGEAEAPQPAAEAPAAEPAPEAPAAEAAPAPSGPSFDSFDDARQYLLEHAKEKVVRAVETVRFHGRLIEKLPQGEIRRAIEGHAERQRRFPLDTANALRGRLRREGFTIFKKGSRGISYVCAVKRRFRVPGQVFSESITALIEFVEKHAMIHVKDLPKEFLGIDVAAALAAAPLPESMPASQAPFAVLPSEQAEKLRKMNNDLRWLVTEGYVTEFSDGRLFAPPPMAPQAPKKEGDHHEEHDPEDFPEGRAPSAAAPAEKTEDHPKTSEEAPAAPAAEETAPAAPEATDDEAAARRNPESES